MLNDVLEYQKIDAQLVSVEQEIARSSAKDTVNKMVGYVKQAQQQLVKIEQSASVLLVEYEELRNQFDANIKLVEDITKQKFEAKEQEELKQDAEKVAQINAKILNIEKNIEELSKKISALLSNFEKTKEQGNLAKKKYEQALKLHNEFIASKQPLVNKLKKELAELETKVDAKILTKYKQLRGDKKFPIFVPLMGNSCGGCSMELPSAKLDTIKANGMLECENCHRIIFIKDKNAK